MHGTEPRYEIPRTKATELLTEATLHVIGLLDTGEGAHPDVVDAVFWGADTLAYGETGTPMTGVRYLSGPNGPYPEIGRRVQKTLTAGSRLRRYYTTDGCRRIEALDRPRLELFDEPTIGRLARLAEMARDAEGAEFLPNDAWELPANGRPIAYQAVFVSKTGTISEADRTRTIELARKHGWTEKAAGAAETGRDTDRVG